MEEFMVMHPYYVCTHYLQFVLLLESMGALCFVKVKHYSEILRCLEMD